MIAGVIPDPLESTPDPKPMENAILYLTREDWATVQGEFQQLLEEFASLKVQLLPDGPLPWLARGLAATDTVNLLQGEFSRTVDYAERWRQWRVAAALAAALLIVHVAAQALQIRQAKHESATLDGQIAQVFASAMPREVMTDPRRQMQNRLERIQDSATRPQFFLRSLQTLSGALPPKATISAMSYRENSIDMTLTAPSLAALSQLTETVGKQGLTAEIQSSSPVASGVEAHVHMRSPAARAHP